jgi:hypothetical protein
MLGLIAKAAAGAGILPVLGIIAVIGGVIVLFLGRLLVGIVLIIVGLLLAFGGFGINLN